MVWVVDGTRLSRDFPRFVKGGKFGSIELKPGIRKAEFGYEFFPSNWLKSSVPVVFDFLGLDNATNADPIRRNLYCLFPSHDEYNVVYAEIPREVFIKTVLNGKWSERVNAFMDEMEQEYIEKQKQRQRDMQQPIYYRRKRFIYPAKVYRKKWRR